FGVMLRSSISVSMGALVVSARTSAPGSSAPLPRGCGAGHAGGRCSAGCCIVFSALYFSKPLMHSGLWEKKVCRKSFAPIPMLL
uniref:Uncharacterized protein n=1 Tax=Aegilops tauschii subsp. strangulata TaxID=200361 RepID=A0A453P6I6_AEGTS